jgi:hypothetical protein
MNQIDDTQMALCYFQQDEAMCEILKQELEEIRKFFGDVITAKGL